MKRIMLILSFVVFCLALPGQGDVFSQMGLSNRDAQNNMLDVVLHGKIPYSLAAKAFLAAPPALRIAWIKGTVAWAKAYISGPEFLKQYQVWRAENRPKPQARLGSAAEEMAKQQEQFRQQVEAMRKNMAQMSEDVRKQMETTIREMEAEFKKRERDPELKQAMEEMYKNLNSNNEAEYKQKLQEFEKTYPADPRQLIARHVLSFLELSSTIDYSARLETRDDRLRFINPDYENKPGEWKLCFRAGRETVEAACNAARAWLTELNRK